MKILVGYNGSPEADAALELARDHARRLGAKVVVVSSAIGGAKEKTEDIDRLAENLKEARLKMETAGVRFEIHELVRGLSPGEDIVKFATDNAVDLIFVGVEKKSKARKLLLGSNAQYIILRAPCPVMTVKAGIPGHQSTSS